MMRMKYYSDSTILAINVMIIIGECLSFSIMFFFLRSAEYISASDVITH